MTSIVITTLKNRLGPRVSGTTESARMSAVGCQTTFIHRDPVPRPPVLIPVDVVPTPASTTTARLRDATLACVTSPNNPDTRFAEFFPAPVPPPQFLQCPPSRNNYEPVARLSGCFNRRTWDTS